MGRILRHMSQNICLSFVAKRQVVSFKRAATWKLCVSTTAAFLNRINYNSRTKNFLMHQLYLGHLGLTLAPL